jgi:hypothetical protein
MYGKMFAQQVGSTTDSHAMRNDHQRSLRANTV